MLRSTQLLIASLALISLLPGCSEDPTTQPDTLLDIDYSALYVVNGGDGNISVIDTERDIVADIISLNGATGPHHINLSPDRKHLAVAVTDADLSGGHGGHGRHDGDYRLMVVDATTGAIVKEVALEEMPHNAAYNSDGSELWVGQAKAAGEVLVFGTNDFGLTTRINVGKNPSEVTFNSDGSAVFVANTGDSSVTIIDPVAKVVRAVLSVGRDPVGAWPSYGGMMYVDNEESRTITEIDSKTMAVRSTIELDFTPGYVAHRSNGNELWISDVTNGRVVMYESDAGNWVRRGTIPVGAGAHAIVFTGNRAKAYVSNQEAGTVSVIDVESTSVIKEIVVGRKPNGMAIREG